MCGEFPGGLVVRTWHFQGCGQGSIPGVGTELQHQAATSCGKTKQNKTKQKTERKKKKRKEKSKRGKMLTFGEFG